MKELQVSTMTEAFRGYYNLSVIKAYLQVAMCNSVSFTIVHFSMN